MMRNVLRRHFWNATKVLQQGPSAVEIESNLSRQRAEVRDDSHGVGLRQKHDLDLTGMLGSGERGKINMFDLEAVTHPRQFKFSRRRHQPKLPTRTSDTSHVGRMSRTPRPKAEKTSKTETAPGLKNRPQISLLLNRRFPLK